MTAPLLEVATLSKRFGGLQAVRDLSLHVGEREIVALIGPNGAGKTTAFGLISGFLPSDAGEIRFRGRSIAGLRPHRVCALGMARTFQIMRPFPRLSVLRNVMIGALGRHADPREASVRARAVLEELGLAAKAEHPAGSLTLAERKRLDRDHGAKPERAVEMREQGAAARGLPSKLAPKPAGLHRHQHQVAFAGEVLLRGFGQLPGGGEMDIAVAAVGFRAVKNALPRGLPPQRLRANFVDSGHRRRPRRAGNPIRRRAGCSRQPCTKRLLDGPESRLYFLGQ